MCDVALTCLKVVIADMRHSCYIFFASIPPFSVKDVEPSNIDSVCSIFITKQFAQPRGSPLLTDALERLKKGEIEFQG